MDESKIYEVPIDQIAADPNQPRQTWNQEQLGELAANLAYDYKTGTAHKMINPIEIDANDIIITGESRWRAAKQLGWATVPVKIVDPGSPEERFLRQVKENVGRGTMSTMDIARALKKVQEGLLASTQLHEQKDEAIRKTAKAVGAPESFVREHLNLLEEEEEIQKAIEAGEIKRTHIRDANKAPEFAEAVKKKIMDGTLTDQRGIHHLTNVLRTTGGALKADELLAEDYSTKSSAQIIRTIDEIAPSPLKQITDKMVVASSLCRQIKNLTVELDSWNKNDFAATSLIEINLNLELLNKAMNRFATVKRNKQLTP